MFLQNSHLSSQRASLFVSEDHDAAIKTIIKRPEPVHELFDGINLDPGIQIKYVNTSKQIADIPTKVSFPRERGTQLTQLFIFDDTACAVLQSFSSVFICTERRQDVEASSRTFDRKRHHQTKAGAQLARP